MGETLEACLKDLESRIDAAEEEALLAKWNAFVEGRMEEEVFRPRRSTPRPAGVKWPRVLVNEAIKDPELMALQQYGTCSEALAEGRGNILCVRANYGTGILPSVFGLRVFMMEDAADTLPTNWPVEGGRDAVWRILSAGLPEKYPGFAGMALAAGKLFRDIGARHPAIGRYVNIYHPDTQSPMDVCELVWGSSLFSDVIEEPVLVKEFLLHVTTLIKAFMRKWHEVVPPPWPDRAVHWGWMHMGRIMLRSDSAMNFSPEMYREFIVPYDQVLLMEFGGGGVHFCGTGDHYIRDLTAMVGVKAVQVSQPHLNDMEAVYVATVDAGIPLMDMAADEVARVTKSGRPLKGRVHCW